MLQLIVASELSALTTSSFTLSLVNVHPFPLLQLTQGIQWLTLVLAAVASMPWLTDNSDRENVYLCPPLKIKSFTDISSLWTMLIHVTWSKHPKIYFMVDLLLMADNVNYHLIICKNKLVQCVTEPEWILSCDCQSFRSSAKINSVLKDGVPQACWLDCATHAQPWPCNVKKCGMNPLLVCFCVHVYLYMNVCTHILYVLIYKWYK